MKTIPAKSRMGPLFLILVMGSAALAGKSSWASNPVYGYRVLEKLPQSRENFVQGLQILDNQLYVSTGRYGSSMLLRYRMSDGKLETQKRVHESLFAEGLTVFGDRIYQLTWRSRLVLVYNKADLRGIAYFKIPGQGWGLTHNHSELIYSDGSHRLHYMSPETGAISHSIDVTENGLPVPRLNELEWIDGHIWANVWQTDRIVIINPDSGEVTASVDLSGLLGAEERLPDTDVLNGIARDPEDGSIWVTGKRWPWLYQIELIARPETDKHSEAPPINSR